MFDEKFYTHMTKIIRDTVSKTSSLIELIKCAKKEIIHKKSVKVKHGNIDSLHSLLVVNNIGSSFLLNYPL